MKIKINKVMLWTYRVYSIIWFLGATVDAIEAIMRVPLYSCLLFACLGNSCLVFIEKFLQLKPLGKGNTRKRVLALTSTSNVILHTCLIMSIVFTKQLLLFPEAILFAIPINFFFLPELLAFLIMLANIELSTVDLIRYFRRSRTGLKKRDVKAPQLVKVT